MALIRYEGDWNKVPKMVYDLVEVVDDHEQSTDVFWLFYWGGRWEIKSPEGTALMYVYDKEVQK